MVRAHTEHVHVNRLTTEKTNQNKKHFLKKILSTSHLVPTKRGYPAKTNSNSVRKDNKSQLRNINCYEEGLCI